MKQTQRLFWLVLLAVASGCQTVAPQTEASIPPAVTRLFGNCAPADGAAAVQVYADGGLLGSTEVSWVARENGNWELEANNPLGGTVLDARRKGLSIKLTGRLAERAPPLAIDDNYWLVVADQPVALKVEEIPCLLHFVWPRPWLQHVAAQSLDGTTSVYEFADGRRRMTLRLPPESSGEPRCATISWRHHLLFTEELKWCLVGSPRPAGSLGGVGAYTLKWVKLDDH